MSRNVIKTKMIQFEGKEHPVDCSSPSRPCVCLSSSNQPLVTCSLSTFRQDELVHLVYIKGRS